MMNAHSNDATNQEPMRHPIAVVALGISLLSAALLVISLVLGAITPEGDTLETFRVIMVPSLLIFSLCIAHLGLLTGTVSLVMVVNSQGRYRGRSFSWIGILISGILCVGYWCMVLVSAGFIFIPLALNT